MSEHVHLEETTPWVWRWLRAEGLAGVALGWVAWQAYGGELVWFLPLLLAPDLSMLGYLRGPRLGATTYNLAHNWLVGGLVLGLGWWLGSAQLSLAGAVLVAHTGMDRLFGYGLKYPSSFHDTHLGRIGRRRPG
ncbi:MAG TPA: DUF4260 domain-containing protein [Candidatus Limnocylindria bacterium]|nr:DUF4260 domain-containing protein [Candidatus Limnocylindria bacterium]